MTEHIEIRIDGALWTVVSEEQEYDAIHAVAGALLAGADTIELERVDDGLLKNIQAEVAEGHDDQ